MGTVINEIRKRISNSLVCWVALLLKRAALLIEVWPESFGVLEMYGGVVVSPVHFLLLLTWKVCRETVLSSCRLAERGFRVRL